MKKIIAVGISVFAPLVAFAQFNEPVTDVNSLITKFDDLVNTLIWALISLAVVYIVWQGVQFIRHAESDDRTAYRNGILWGVVGLFLILSIWGLVNILGDTFGTGNAENANQDIASQNARHLLLEP